MKSGVNPLKRSTPQAHIPLLLLSALFMLPLVWLISSSLQPREQIGGIPPDWLPRMYLVQTPDGRELRCTAPVELTSEMVLIEIIGGARAGEKQVVPSTAMAGENWITRERRADVTIEVALPAKVLERYPATHIRVREWRLSKYTAGIPEEFYVSPERVSRRVEPVVGNFTEAVRALSPDREDKTRPLPELLGRSRMPWTQSSEGTSITFLTYVVNTLVVAILGTFGTLLSSSLAAYGLSRITWRGRETLFKLTLATMMIPFPVLMVPLYAVFRELGLIGTLMPLWLPAFFGGAFNIFLLRQFFRTIPEELCEAARIDGCSEFGIYWRIMLPLSKPALIAVGLFHFLYAWNDFLGPLIFLTKPETFTIALGLQQYQSQHGGSEWHLLMAAATLLIAPVLLLFFAFQKNFIQGIATTGGK